MKKIFVGAIAVALVAVALLAGCAQKEAVEKLELGGSLPTITLADIDANAKYYAASISAADEEDGMIISVTCDSNAPDFDVYRWPKVESDEEITDLAKYAAWEAGEADTTAELTKFMDTGIPCYVYTSSERHNGKTTACTNMIMEDGEDFVEVVMFEKAAK